MLNHRGFSAIQGFTAMTLQLEIHPAAPDPIEFTATVRTATYGTDRLRVARRRSSR
jgi:hypothetical protein